MTGRGNAHTARNLAGIFHVGFSEAAAEIGLFDPDDETLHEQCPESGVEKQRQLATSAIEWTGSAPDFLTQRNR